jgi:hypothetical protein
VDIVDVLVGLVGITKAIENSIRNSYGKEVAKGMIQKYIETVQSISDGTTSIFCGVKNEESAIAIDSNIIEFMKNFKNSENS